MLVNNEKLRKKITLALLIRGLPRNATEIDVRSILRQYTGYEIRQIELSKRYCLVEMNSSKEASYLLDIFNKIAPYIHNSRGNKL